MKPIYKDIYQKVHFGEYHRIFMDINKNISNDVWFYGWSLL